MTTRTEKIVSLRLLDIEEYVQRTGRVVRRGLVSYDVKKYSETLWSNGWCPTTEIKLCNNGEYIARISNELVPTNIYHNVVIKARIVD